MELQDNIKVLTLEILKLKAVVVAPQRISNHGGESAEMSIIAPVEGNKLPWNVLVRGEKENA